MERRKEQKKDLQFLFVDSNSKEEMAALLKKVAVQKLTEEARCLLHREE